MDADTTVRIDEIVADEVHRGYRDVAVDPETLAALREAHGLDPEVPAFERVRFLKLTPRRRRLINEAVVARYHADLQNKELLSNEQLKKINAERGEWTEEHQARLEKLQRDTVAKMQVLLLEEDPGVWHERARELADKYLLVCRKGMAPEAYDAHVPVVTRWLEYTPDDAADYTAKHAASQGREAYSYDADTQSLLDKAPTLEAVEMVRDLEDVHDQIWDYLSLLRDRTDLAELQLRYAKIFSESAESRRDTADELARIYYSTENLGADGKPTGPLTPTFDGMWDLPEDGVQWLVTEAYFFFNNVPNDAREFMARWGFFGRKVAGGRPASAASPEAETSSSDSSASTATPAASSDPSPPMTSATPSSTSGSGDGSTGS